MLWDPFLIKKLLKNVIYRICEQCTDALSTVDKVNYYGLNKKKKREKRKAETQTPESLQSKQALSVRLGERRLRDLRFLVGPMNMVHRSLKIEKAHVRAPKTDPKRSSASLLGNAVAVLNPALRIFPPKTLEN